MMKNTKAFTLIEVVLAMMIMASGLLILTNSWSGTYNRLRKTQIQVQMAALLERKVVEIEKEWKGKPLDTVVEEKSDSFSEFPGYSWKMTSQKLEFPDLTPLLMLDTDGVKSDLISVMKFFSEYISKSVREVKVEIFYQDKKKPLVVDVVFYLVDYDKPLPIPGAPGGG